MSPKDSTKKEKKAPLIVGNWKMYKTIDEAIKFIETLAPLLKESQVQPSLAVPYTTIYPLRERIKKMGIHLQIGAQNMNDASEGAFTGEIAAKMLKEAGASFVILGHSERRHLFNENDAFINKKVKRAFEEKIQPLFCIGETLEEREGGRQKQVLEKQLTKGLEGISEEEVGDLILAYEPVWAIGTGRVAHTKDIEEAHAFCRRLIENHWGKKASMLSILYGGSVKADNAEEILDCVEVDGLLIGGASLSPETFGKIITMAAVRT